VRIKGRSSREAFHLSVRPVGRLRIDIGDIVPDIGIGLLSSARRFTYPFSSGHPFYRPAGVRGWTGFYGEFIRGCAARALAGRILITTAAGLPAGHGAEGVEYGDRRAVLLARIENVSGPARLGVSTVLRADCREAGFDLCVEREAAVFRLEAAAAEDSRAAVAWGASVDPGDLRIGVLAWSVPPGSCSFLASFPGLSHAGQRHRSGASIMLSRRFSGRSWISAWCEARGSEGGRDTRMATAVRMEAGRRWKRCSLRLAMSCRGEREEELSPFPPPAPAVLDRVSSALVSGAIRISKLIAITAELKRSDTEGGEGMLAAVRGSAGPFAGRLSIRFSAASWGSGRGRARFALYEPGAEGRFPWRTVYGRGSSLTAGIGIKTGVMRGSAWLVSRSGEGVQAVFSLSVSI
jgi:hypothetical protein